MDHDDENSQLLKQMGGFKKRRAPKKMPWNPLKTFKLNYFIHTENNNNGDDLIWSYDSKQRIRPMIKFSAFKALIVS